MSPALTAAKPTAALATALATTLAAEVAPAAAAAAQLPAAVQRGGLQPMAPGTRSRLLPLAKHVHRARPVLHTALRRHAHHVPIERVWPALSL